MKEVSKGRIKIPHVFIFLSGIILFCSVLTYIVPSGKFDRTTQKLGNMERVVVVPGTYEKIPKHISFKGLILGEKREGKASPTSILGLFSAIPKGMYQAAGLIFFIFTVGAVFTLIQETGTSTAIIYELMEKFRNYPVLLPALLFTGIAIGGTMLGMLVEFIPMIPIFLLLSKKLGYDRLFGVAIIILAVSIGWMTGITNPFNIQIAQQIAEVPIGSGSSFRAVFFIACYSAGLFYLVRYGNRVRKDPSRSIMKNDSFIIPESEIKHVELEKKHIYIAITAIVLFAIILYAVQVMGWGSIEMSGGFLAVGVITILICRMKGDEAMSILIRGLQQMIVPALIVGIARAIQVVMDEGQIIDTLLNHAAGVLQEQPKLLATQGMFLFQSTLNFFIPSASGQAMVTMPLMVPLSDLLQLSRQMATFAFLIGDGISNLIIPTNGVLMAVLGIAGVPYEKWFKFILPLFLILISIGAIFLTIALYIGH